MSFKNKVIWITGASSGIGEALAKAFNEAEAIVILSARNLNELERVKNSFVNKYIPSKIVLLDLEEIADFESITQNILAEFGQIDIIIHNAGISQRAFAEETAFADEKRIISLNLLGTIALTKCVLPHFLAQKKGHIVLISSVMGKIPTKYRSSYAAAKHGLIGYFDCLRLELEGKVEVTNIMPGFVNTNIVKNAVSTGFNADNLNKKGMSPDIFAQKALAVIAKRKKEAYIGGIKEGFALFARRYLPFLFNILIKNAKVV